MYAHSAFIMASNFNTSAQHTLFSASGLVQSRLLAIKMICWYDGIMDDRHAMNCISPALSSRDQPWSCSVDAARLKSNHNVAWNTVYDSQVCIPQSLSELNWLPPPPFTAMAHRSFHQSDNGRCSLHLNVNPNKNTSHTKQNTMEIQCCEIINLVLCMVHLDVLHVNMDHA